MPIPANQQQHVECIVRGDIPSGGSNSRPTWNVFYFRRTALVGAVNKTNVEAAFQTNIGAPLGAALNVRWSQTYNTVRVLNDVNDQVLQVPHVIAGGVAGDSMPLASYAYILARTNLRKGSFRGAKKLGPLSEADTTIGSSDILNAAALARLATFNAAWLAGFTDAGGMVWVPVVLARKLSQIKTNPTTVVATDIGSILTNKTIRESRVRKVLTVY